MHAKNIISELAGIPSLTLRVTKKCEHDRLCHEFSRGTGEASVTRLNR